ncbi:PRC-barrel domain containing protein [Haladaptatus sp. CMAA 1911]|uniref:PRC-barrel domain containing protein n=1 Tax=unclassified Haladaptatus TaxID=2622732 RepID=UPI0037544327
MATTQITEDDEGKKVVDESGDEVGIVSDVDHGTAHIDPNPGVTDKVKSKLGWGDKDEETYPLQEEMVSSITDDEIRLQA